MVKNMPVNARRYRKHRFSPWVRKIPLEKEITTCSSILARIIPWAEESGGLQPMGPKESDTTEQLNNSLCLLGSFKDVSYSPLSAIHTLQGLNKRFAVVVVQSCGRV